ncbi:MAG: Hpt domain-containing protein [Spirochaetaceae bacterium]|nr:MAG: Hpt domain-containing protein [Spirochaetaceae bacterium]
MNHNDTDAAYSLDAFADTYAEHPEILAEVLNIFLAETPEKLASLHKAIGEKDLPAAVRVAHSLANTTGTLKANRALRAARAVESVARAGDVEAARVATDDLSSELNRVIEVIREAIQ